MRWLALVVLSGCATAPEPRPERPPVPRPTARSSVAAVLAHADELQLTVEQREKLAAIDEAMAKKLEALREERRMQREAAPGGGGWGMGGGGMGRRGGMGGGRHRGGGGSVPHPPEEARRSAVDDADTAAFLEAEALLTEPQKPRARELASQYRSQLYEWRRSRDERGGAQDAR